MESQGQDLKFNLKIEINNHELLPHVKTFKELENLNMRQGDVLKMNYTFKVPFLDIDLPRNLEAIYSILEDSSSNLDFEEEEYRNYANIRNIIYNLNQKFKKIDQQIAKKWSDNEIFRNSVVKSLASPGYEPNLVEEAFVGCELEKRK